MSGFIWAPEMHLIDGRWTMYFAAGPSGGGEDVFRIRTFAVVCDGPDPMTGNWSVLGQLQTEWDTFNLDSTSFVHKGQRYLAWAQRELSRVFPEATVLELSYHDWKADEFSQGTWAIHRPGWYANHHAAMQVGGRVDRDDRLEMRRARRRGRERGDPGIGHAPHADIAVAPGLRRDPFHQIVTVLPLARREGAWRDTARIAEPAQIGRHRRVAARHEMPVHRGDRRPTAAPVLVIRAEIEDRRMAPLPRRPHHVGREFDPVAHRHEDIAHRHAGVAHRNFLSQGSRRRYRETPRCAPRFCTVPARTITCGSAGPIAVAAPGQMPRRRSSARAATTRRSVQPVADLGVWNT
jgi:hypothetical protein